MFIKARNRSRKAQLGFTLIEFMGVALLAALVIFLVLRQQRAANVRSDAATIASSVAFVQQKAASIYTPNFAAMTNCTGLANNGGFSGGSFRVDRTANPAAPTVYYSQEPTTVITCAPATLFGTNDGFSLTMPGFSNDACAEVVDQVGAIAWRVDVNGTNVKPLRGVINPDTKGTECSSGDDDNTITFVFGRQVAPQ